MGLWVSMEDFLSSHRGDADGAARSPIKIGRTLKVERVGRRRPYGGTRNAHAFRYDNPPEGKVCGGSLVARCAGRPSVFFVPLW
jgi:hypothetical protein